MSVLDTPARIEAFHETCPQALEQSSHERIVTELALGHEAHRLRKCSGENDAVNVARVIRHDHAGTVRQMPEPVTSILHPLRRANSRASARETVQRCPGLGRSRIAGTARSVSNPKHDQTQAP
jgi:hypothetical protein